MRRARPTASLIPAALLALAAACGGGRSQLPGPGTTTGAGGWPGTTGSPGGAGGSTTSSSTTTGGTGGSPVLCAIRSYPVGDEPMSVAIADFDRDGRLDVAVANRKGHSFSVLRGKGDGTFAEQVEAPLGAPGWGIAAGDLDGDGWPDLVVTSLNAGTANALLNDGNGGFGAPVPIPFGFQAGAVTLADMNGDGRLDVIVATGSGVGVGLVGTGGQVAFPSEMPTPSISLGPSGLVVTDLDGDGLLDVAAGTVSPISYFFMLKGTGDGMFQSPPYMPWSKLHSAYTIGAGDLDGDGRPDLVFSDVTTSDLVVMRNAGGFKFAQPVRYQVGAPNGLVVADLDGDGKLDIAASVLVGDTQLAVLRNQGDGTFAPAATLSLPHLAGMIRAADLDGNGRLDLVLTDTGGDSITIVPDTCLP